MKKNNKGKAQSKTNANTVLTAGVQGAAVRVIKFRALKDDMSNCNWMYGQLVYDAIGCPRITEVDSSGQGLTFHTCLKGTESQYTGLQDINGKDIYEGDILSNTVAKWQVVFNKGCFCHKRIGVNIPDKGEDATEMALRGLVGREIIGNIYENAGLLAVAPLNACS